MELEELKNIWKSYTEEQGQQISPAEIKEMLSGRTQNAISKINRSIFLEVGLLLVMSFVFSITTLLVGQIEHQILFAMIMVICVLSGGYYFFKYRQINAVAITSDNLKNSLQKLIHVLDTFLKIYLYGSIIITPISFLTGFFYGFTLAGEDHTLQQAMQWEIIAISLGLTVIATLLMYPFMKWYIRRLYGNYLQELKTCMHELEAGVSSEDQ